MRVVLVASAFLLAVLSGCLSEEPESADVQDTSSGTSCTATANATSASVSCTSSAPAGNRTGSTTTTSTAPAGNASGNQTTGQGNSTASGNATVGGNETGNQTSSGNQTAPAGEPRTFSCTVQLGTAGVSVRGTVNLGACSMGTTEMPMTVTAIRAPSGCTAKYDTNPDDTALTGNAAVGERYDEGTEFVLSCGPGAVNAKGELDAVPS